MNYQRISLQELWKYLDGDRDKNRFVARVFFVDNFNTYYSLVDSLSERADITIRLSDERFCKGDVVPDMRALITFLDENKDKDTLDHVTWSVKIDGLSAGNSYSMYVYPNNLTTQQSEMIYVKRRGVVVDDDL